MDLRGVICRSFFYWRDTTSVPGGLKMKCPKCGHSQTSTVECGQCGIIFEKFQALHARQSERAHSKQHTEAIADSEIGGSPDPQYPKNIRGFIQAYVWGTFKEPWKPVPKYGVIALTLFFAYLFFLLYREPFYQLYPTTNMMDSSILSLYRKVDLVFHEGGHWIFGIFGIRTVTIFGGSLNQVLVPLIVTVAFWKSRDASGYAFGLVWMFVNFLEVAIYMADARHPVLPLISGLDAFQSHDWLNLFNILDLWSYDTLIAKMTFQLGWIGMVATSLWYVWAGFTNLSKGNDDSATRFLNRKKENKKNHRPLEI